MTRAIDAVRRCRTMEDVRRAVDALDDQLVPLLVTRGGYMTEAARIKRTQSAVRDEARIDAIVRRVRKEAAAHGGDADLIESVYRAMMEAYIAFEEREFARLRSGVTS